MHGSCHDDLVLVEDCDPGQAALPPLPRPDKALVFTQLRLQQYTYTRQDITLFKALYPTTWPLLYNLNGLYMV